MEEGEGEYYLGSIGYVNCHTCGTPVRNDEKFEFLEISKIKRLYRNLFGGRYYELRCQSCVRDMKIKKVLN